MTGITVPFGILADGYTVSGGRTSGLRARVPYLVAWGDAFAFVNEMLGYTRQASPAAPIHIQFGLPFPASANILAETFEIEPCGPGGETGETLGLSPGEFWKFARVTIGFEPPRYDLVQLDPANPLTFCEVEIDTGGQIETVKAEGYEFDTDTESPPGTGPYFPVTGDLGKVVATSRLILTFPLVPSLPWQAVQEYIGTLNDEELLLCDRGTLLFEDCKTKFAFTSEGVQGKQVQITMAYNKIGWNWVPKSNGEYCSVHKKGDTSSSIYDYTNLLDLFPAVDGEED